MGATTDLFAGLLPFFHVAEEKSYRRAAERLGVTPAAVSKAVLKLEAELGAPLLVRTSRSVAMTPEGEAFLSHCREAVRAVLAGREQVKASRRQPKGQVHLTLSPILGSTLLRELSRLADAHPGLTFKITVTDRLVRLAEEGVDVAVRLGKPEDSGLVGRLLSRPRWVTVATPRWVGKHGMPTTPRALEGLPCLRFVGPSGRVRSWVFTDLETGGTQSLDVDGSLLIDQGERLLDAALAGMGACQVLDFMVTDHLREGRLVELLRAHSAPGPEIHALWPRERSRSPNVRAVVAFVAELLLAPSTSG